MEFKQIQELLKAVNKSNLSEVSIKDGEFELHIKQASVEPNFITLPQGSLAPAAMQQFLPPINPTAPPQAASEKPVQEDESNLIIIKSPMIGTFYRSNGPDKPAFVNVGDSIKSGTVLCIVEAMKLFNEIESEVSGKIVKALVDDASPVEYDQPLFLVEPE